MRRFAHTEMEDARDEKAVGVAGAAAAGMPYTFGRRQGSPADAILFAASIQAPPSPPARPSS